MQGKTLWKNNTAQGDAEGGHVIGVSVYHGRTGEATRQPIQPGETVWLTEDERILTANAPREERDNPFVNGDLIQVSEEARPIGRSIGSTQEAPMGAPEPEAAPEPPAPSLTDEEVERAEARAAERERTSQLPPDLRLGGTDEEVEETPSIPAGPIDLVPEPGVTEVAEEEHAAAPPEAIAEETGASVPPAGEPPVGEFAKHEEVATPEAAGAQETAVVKDGRPQPSPDPIDQENGLHALDVPQPETPADQSANGRFRVK